MKALILAAGYGTRLYPITIDIPKPLLIVRDKPVLEYIIRRIERIDSVDKIYIVTNQKFFSSFVEWLKGFRSSKSIEILNDLTTSNQNRLGAVGDMGFAINQTKIQDDLLIVGGDNLFSTDLNNFVDFSISKRPFFSIGLYDVKDLILAKNYGVVELDADYRIINFVEKPNEPKSTIVAKCLYFFSKERLKIISEYLALELAEDAPGYLIEWLYKKDVVYGFIFSEPWFDIGHKDLYEEAQREFACSTETESKANLPRFKTLKI